MKLKGGSFILENIEKIILPIIAVLFLWLLFAEVIMSPNNVEYNGKSYSPGEIDKELLKEAENIVYRLNSEPSQKEAYTPKSKEFTAMFNSSVDVDTSVWPTIPFTVSQRWDGRQYAIPASPEISDASIEHIRAVAYIPKEEVNIKHPYSEVETEPNDLDIVTVEAKVDIKKLYESFEDTFAGLSVKPQWRDPCLAEPVFAAVRLQRSQLQDDGQWSPYQEVPRTKVDNLSSLLKIVENVQDFPRGGMEVRLLQYKNTVVKSDLLQPLAYDIGSSEEDWFPPTFHSEFVQRIAEQKAAKRKEEMEAKRAERQQEKEEARSRRRETRTREIPGATGGMGGGGGMGDLPGGMGGGVGGGMMTDLPGGGDMGNRRPRRDRTAERQKRQQEIEEKRRQRGEDTKEDEKTVDAVYEKFDKIRINEDTRFAKMTEPLLFWANDDTVEPGKTYRYKIQLGVFNPVAGTRKIKSEYESYKNQAILWSNVLETEEIEIPKKLYFFAKGIQQAANAVKLEVFRYVLGYWYSQEDTVEPGEEIGKIEELENEDDSSSTSLASEEAAIITPDKVDFRTGAIMVDTSEVQDWFGINVLLPRNYFNFYYSYDQSSIMETPIEQRFWTLETRNLYKDISKASKEDKEPLRPRGQGIKGSGPSQQLPQMPGMNGLPPEMMMDLPPNML